MEAVAKFDFEGSRGDELSFTKGSRLFVTSKEENGDWFHAFAGNMSGYIPATYIDMAPHEWFREKLGRSQAEKILLSEAARDFVYPNGAFIIRKSESDANGFALSVRCGTTVQHFKILRDATNKFYIWPKMSFFSLNELVARYKTESVSGDPCKEIILRELCHEECKALYDFAPANDEELQLRKGDIIKIISKSDPNWWEGEVEGRKGFFPTNYVTQIRS